MPWPIGTRRGRRGLFERVALPHLDRLHFAALRLTGDAADAEDLIQETFLRAYRKFYHLRDQARCHAWLFRIMARVWSDMRDKRRGLMPAGASEELEELASWRAGRACGGPCAASDSELMAALVREDVVRALDLLPPEYRAVVVMVDAEGFTYKEASQMLGCPIGTVMSRLHRARRILEAHLRHYRVERRERP